jgi:hypothetical protein
MLGSPTLPRRGLVAGVITLAMAVRVLAGDWSSTPGLGPDIALAMAAIHMVLHVATVQVLRRFGRMSADLLAAYRHPRNLSQQDFAFFWLAVLLLARHI